MGENEGGNGGAPGAAASTVSPMLCGAYRETVTARLDGQDERIATSEKNIIFTVKLVGLALGIVLSIVQLAVTMYFLG